MFVVKIRIRKNRIVSRTAGYTLIELLVAIGIIALLIAIIFPSLRPAKDSARRTRNMVVCHELLMSLHMYTSDNNSFFPYFATPGDPDGPIRVREFDFQDDLRSYFRAQDTFWPSLIYPDYFSSRDDLETNDLYESYHVEANYPEYIVISHYFLTDTVFAVPEYWVSDEPPDDLSLLHGVTIDDVQYPSDKGELVDMREISIEHPVNIGMFDGSIRKLNWPSSYDEQIHGTGWVSRPFGARVFPVMTTRKGVWGRDF